MLRDQVHTPLIVRAPGFAKNVKVDALTELVDIYPSLCELCALRAPENQLQGDSFVPMLHDASTVLKDRVFYRSEYGKAVLTKDFNYWELPNKKGKLEQVLLKTETQLNEKGNLASLPEYRNIAVDMAEALRKGWRWAG